MDPIYVSAGFSWPDGDCVASASITWDDNLVVTVSNVRYSYISGAAISATCKWRIKDSITGSIVAGYTDYGYLGDTFVASDGEMFLFQACVSGPYPWGNSINGDSNFTVTRDSGGDPGGGVDPPDTPTQYTIRYDANGGTGAPSIHYKTHDVIVYLSNTIPSKASAVTGSYKITFDAGIGQCDVKTLDATITTSYKFGHWNTNRQGTGIGYSPGYAYTWNEDLYLYAIYTEDSVVSSVTLPVASLGGYEFMGWSTKPNDTIGLSGKYTPSDDITLYAVWKANGLIYIYDGENFNAYQVFIYDGSSWDMYIPFIYDSDWCMCS